ncbi:uncharacterized protein LACBIDRAFT_313580 [Laccaria bicolor S238N-H82]|uniref:Predicted protein n=1 Tax=Laccaria bicolor (strain S238N-H82 / ATCC MYA-4686) TaxID=486041 RepID=B0D0B3_LACBS|nr:uncharacterized protein LACBIDRAFT_313580 [Laccaria bicolor S238N-H82]EDR11800.1 predicted protein [Laccaria bicolor S238N-H82]|eukprot:XP_001877697.1 predicted protein [Laccaria bicolor S238N-H82]
MVTPEATSFQRGSCGYEYPASLYLLGLVPRNKSSLLLGHLFVSYIQLYPHSFDFARFV